MRPVIGICRSKRVKNDWLKFVEILKILNCVRSERPNSLKCFDFQFLLLLFLLIVSTFLASNLKYMHNLKIYNQSNPFNG